MGIYTDATRINRRLANRLTTGASTAFGLTQVDPTFLVDVIDQVEARVNGRLRLKFSVPISDTELIKIVRGIVEKYVICEVLPTYFANTEESQEGGFGALMCEQAEDELEQLLSGDIEVSEPSEESSVLSNYSQSALYSPSRSNRDAQSIVWR